MATREIVAPLTVTPVVIHVCAPDAEGMPVGETVILPAAPAEAAAAVSHALARTPATSLSAGVPPAGRETVTFDCTAALTF